MAVATRAIRNHLKLADLIIEVCDSRVRTLSKFQYLSPPLCVCNVIASVVILLNRFLCILQMKIYSLSLIPNTMSLLSIRKTWPIQI